MTPVSLLGEGKRETVFSVTPRAEPRKSVDGPRGSCGTLEQEHQHTMVLMPQTDRPRLGVGNHKEPWPGSAIWVVRLLPRWGSHSEQLGPRQREQEQSGSTRVVLKGGTVLPR